MQQETELPESFTLRANLGVFKMYGVAGDCYEGSANGFTLSIMVEPHGSCWSYTAELTCTEEKYGFVPGEKEGNFIQFDELTASVSKWVDIICTELIEDFDRDTRHLDTGRGHIAFWGYNTHLDSIPVVFVHGGPGGDSNPVKARRLHLDHPVYCYDQMGCGHSDPIVDLGSWSADDYVAELSAFVDSLGSREVILIGASWGAGLCMAYARSTGCGKIAAMVLPSPFFSSALWTADAEQNLRSMGGEYYETYRRCTGSRDFGQEFTKVLAEYNSRFLFSRTLFREWAVASASEVPNDVFKTLCGPNDLFTDGTLKDFDVTGFLPEVDVPVLYICGDSDEVTIPRICEYQHKTPGSRLSIIPHAGHVLATEQFDLYKGSIKAFFEENGL